MTNQGVSDAEAPHCRQATTSSSATAKEIATMVHKTKAHPAESIKGVSPKPTNVVKPPPPPPPPKKKD